MQPPESNWEPAGYRYLIDTYGLKVLPPHRESFVAERGVRQRWAEDGRVREVFSPPYARPDRLDEQLAFALKYDGVELGVLAALFREVPAQDIAELVRQKPTGKYTRRVWFLFEWLTGERLDLPNLDRGNYIGLLDPEKYYTGPVEPVSRQRINNNLLGGPAFCPTVRRTERLEAFDAAQWDRVCREQVEGVPEAVLRRAVSYLFLKETRSSFEIERETPTASRAERFVSALVSADSEDYVTKNRLLALQNEIVESRFRDDDYRADQNYIGQSTGYTEQKIHCVFPPPGEVPGLMAGIERLHRRLETGLLPEVPAVIHAAAVSFGFVFTHPFSDGNGRIHRFLIHHVLARRGFTPDGLILPVSAVMLEQQPAYDATLEAFSRPLLEIIDYTLDDVGRMMVSGDTAAFYRFPDLTRQAETLADFVEQTVCKSVPQEIHFLLSYDRARTAVRDIVDMPDRLLDLLLRLMGQQGGRLSVRKREKHFAMLTDDEVARIEAAFAVTIQTDTDS